MLPEVGLARLQDQQLTLLSGCYWGLFTNNYTPVYATVWADLTEAAWTGYARALAGGWSSSFASSPRVQSVPTSFPVFTNTSGGDVTIYGWFLLDTSDNTLIAATNIGSTTIPDGLSFVLAAAISDRQE